MKDDPYSRVDYRRMIAWPARIQREAPFLLEILSQAPKESVLDLGCGTGEHSRFLAESGYRVLGVDRSESMLKKALEHPVPPALEFALSDLGELAEVTAKRFGAAISLGNTVPHLTSRRQVKRFFRALNLRLVQGGLFLFQMLNYDRIFKDRIRYLPLNFREDGDGEIVFLRLMELREDGSVLFCPCTLRFDPAQDEPLSVLRSKAVELMGWKFKDLVPMLEEHGFGIESVHGDMEFGPYDPDSSTDLVVVARKVRG